MAAGCAVDATGTYLVLFSFSKNLNNFRSLLQHSVVITLWITREAIPLPTPATPPSLKGLNWSEQGYCLSCPYGVFLSPVTSSIKHPASKCQDHIEICIKSNAGLTYEQYNLSSSISGTLALDSFLLDASVPVWIRPNTWAPVSQWSNDPDTPTIAALEEGIHSRLCFSMSYF